MCTIFIIEGKNIKNITDFYTEINRLIMQEEDWQIGVSLDALDDLLYGGYGALKNLELVHFIWKNSEISRKNLGVETTKKYYSNKLQQPKIFNTSFFKEKLNKLENGQGQTYFDIILEIFESHQNIVLQLQ